MSKIETVVQDFGKYPDRVAGDVFIIAKILLGFDRALDQYRPDWTPEQKQEFMQQAWAASNSYRRDLMNQPCDGKMLPLDLPTSYDGTFILNLLEYAEQMHRVHPQMFQGYGKSKPIAIGAKVVLAIHRQEYEGLVGVVLTEAHGKLVVSFPHEDGTIVGRFYTNELIDLGDYCAQIQVSKSMD